MPENGGWAATLHRLIFLRNATVGGPYDKTPLSILRFAARADGRHGAWQRALFRNAESNIVRNRHGLRLWRTWRHRDNYLAERFFVAIHGRREQRNLGDNPELERSDNLGRDHEQRLCRADRQRGQ